MEFLDTITVDSHFRSRVAAVAEHLGGVQVAAATSRWDRFVGQLELGERAANEAAILIVGPPAAVLAHAAQATGDFGFVTPVAQLETRWQRASRWRDDTTLDLWDMGWSPITVDRLIVATPVAPVEFVIASVRRTPANASELPGATDTPEVE